VLFDIYRKVGRETGVMEWRSVGMRGLGDCTAETPFDVAQDRLRATPSTKLRMRGYEEFRSW